MSANLKSGTDCLEHMTIQIFLTLILRAPSAFCLMPKRIAKSLDPVHVTEDVFVLHDDVNADFLADLTECFLKFN
jgi:hypothetical protein